MKTGARAVFALAGQQIRGWRAHLRRFRWSYGGLAVLLGVASLYSIPRDKTWVAWISHDQHVLLKVTQFLTHWGDFRGTLIVAALVLVLGLVLRREHLRHAALAVVLAAALSGAAANVARVAVGRPRPVSNKPDGLYGPTFKYKLHGFPSAHATTASATASVLLVATPVIGVPVTGAALAVMWSRVHLRAHHPTDIVAGAFLGALFGVGFGATARRRRREETSRAEADH